MPIATMSVYITIHQHRNKKKRRRFFFLRKKRTIKSKTSKKMKKNHQANADENQSIFYVHDSEHALKFIQCVSERVLSSECVAVLGPPRVLNNAIKKIQTWQSTYDFIPIMLFLFFLLKFIFRLLFIYFTRFTQWRTHNALLYTFSSIHEL